MKKKFVFFNREVCFNKRMNILLYLIYNIKIMVLEIHSPKSYYEFLYAIIMYIVQ